MRAAARKGLSSSSSRSDSDIATAFVLEDIITVQPSSFLVAPEKIVAALLQTSKHYFGLRGCGSSGVVHAGNFDASETVLF